MSRTLLNQPWCGSCHYEAIHSLLSITGIPVPRYIFRARSIYSRKLFHSSSRILSERILSTKQEPEKLAFTDSYSVTQTQPIPWYLQEEASTAESQPVSLHDQLPDLPDDPPIILQPLLEYVFKDLGVNNLKLIDLRGLQTPAALGVNVIMVIGTSRSVKHLNVSADRLCRWLRTVWRLTPYADGLLGRNELKIKLRRKVRRTRAATQAGAIFDDKDDGITTGWICVNAGVVQEEPNRSALKEHGVEGFGNLDRGVRVVVQIFTEEKRGEVDLEGLWRKRLEVDAREKQKLLNASSKPITEEVRDPEMENRPPSDYDSGQFIRRPTGYLSHQKRSLHLSRGLKRMSNEDGKDKARQPLEGLDGLSPGPEVREALTASGVTMTYLFQYLSSLSPERVRDELGTGPGDSESTLFVRVFRQRQSEIPPEDAALAGIQLFCVAVTRQHPSYSKQALWEEFMSYVRSGYVVSDDLGMLVISALLKERSTSMSVDGYKITASDTELALRVCEHLNLQGMNLLNMRVFNMFYNAARHAPPTMTGEKSWGIGAKNEALVRIPRVIEAFDIPFDPEESRIFMWYLFEEKDYDGFWRLWHDLPRNGSSRTAADYEKLFRVHAELGDARRANECVSKWAPMMGKECPPVKEHWSIMQHAQACLALRDREEEDMISFQKRLLDEELDSWL